MFSPMDVACQRQGAYGDFGDWLDSVKSGLAQVVPANTIVGKWSRGDTAGAAASAGNFAIDALTPKAHAAGGGAGGAAPSGGGLQPMLARSTKSNVWLYVGLGSAALLVGALILRSRRK